jgi:purine-nucleoside phosphorylase
MAVFAEFGAAARALYPRTAIVLGSGLAEAAAGFRTAASIPYREIPGLASPTIPGHRGRLELGTFDDVPALIFHGRLHVYEGHSRQTVTEIVRVAARLGVKRLVLTNAAGGIHPALSPGSLMCIRGHLNLIDANSWRNLPRPHAVHEPYTLPLIHALGDHERTRGRHVPVGIYAAMTGPSYETPAEIRALAACGADAVGMSTALEAETAAELGMEAAAISCVTNMGAGIGSESLDHADVLVLAARMAAHLGEFIRLLVRQQPQV